MSDSKLSPPYVVKRGENNYVVVRKREDGVEFTVSPNVYQTELQANTYLDGLKASASLKSMANTGSAA